MSEQNLVASNPFGSVSEIKMEGALIESESQRAIQEVQAALVIAKRFPRDSIRAMDRIINDCCRPTLAATALYCYPRGGVEVTGPSIRLAEAMAQSWGNMEFGVKELSTDDKSSEIMAYAWDLETNTKQIKTFRVGHSRYTRKDGVKKLIDPRDIYEAIANSGARRLRACILGVIPGDVTEAAVRQCHLTQNANIEVTPESIKSMVNAFKEEFAVTDEMIQQRIGKRSEAIEAPQMLNLKKIFQSLRDGMSKPGDWFEVAELKVAEVSDLNEMLKENMVTKDKINQPAEKAKDAEQVGAGSDGKEQAKAEASDLTLEVVNLEEFIKRVKAADTSELLQQLKILAANFEKDTEDYDEASKAYKRKKLQLANGAKNKQEPALSEVEEPETSRKKKAPKVDLGVE